MQIANSRTGRRLEAVDRTATAFARFYSPTRPLRQSKGAMRCAFLCKTNPISAFLSYEWGSSVETKPNEADRRPEAGDRRPEGTTHLPFCRPVPAGRVRRVPGCEGAEAAYRFVRNKAKFRRFRAKNWGWARKQSQFQRPAAAVDGGWWIAYDG